MRNNENTPETEQPGHWQVGTQHAQAVRKGHLQRELQTT